MREEGVKLRNFLTLIIIKVSEKRHRSLRLKISFLIPLNRVVTICTVCHNNEICCICLLTLLVWFIKKLILWSLVPCGSYDIQDNQLLFLQLPQL